MLSLGAEVLNHSLLQRLVLLEELCCERGERSPLPQLHGDAVRQG